MGCILWSPSISLNERQSKTELKLIYAIAGVEEADSPATWSHPHSSESVTKVWKNGIKVADQKRWKYVRLMCINIETAVLCCILSFRWLPGVWILYAMQSFYQQIGLKFEEKLVKCYVWSMALYGAETWTLRSADQKRLESFEMRCWRRMEKISWTDHVRNEKVLESMSRRISYMK